MKVLRTHFILYVGDQQRSTDFYKSVLEIEPTVNVPGMTEFRLGENVVLGLMPEDSIARLLGDAVTHPSKARGVPRSESVW
ncbi:MAG: VOC family protein [Pyrinomonadaceae bacterium]